MPVELSFGTQTIRLETSSVNIKLFDFTFTYTSLLQINNGALKQVQQSSWNPVTIYLIALNKNINIKLNDKIVSLGIIYDFLLLLISYLGDGFS